MNEYSKEELEEAKTALASTFTQVWNKIQESGKLQSSKKALNDRRVKALRIALTLIEIEMRSNNWVFRSSLHPGFQISATAASPHKNIQEEKDSECTAPTINEKTLQTAVVKAINELLANKEPFLSTLQKNITTIFNEENDNATDDIDSKLEELQQQLLVQAKSKNDYEDVADEIYRLRELKQNALDENAEREGKRQRIAEMTDFLNEQSCELEEYDEQLVRRLIERVTVHDDRIEVEFKSSIELDIRLAAD